MDGALLTARQKGVGAIHSWLTATATKTVWGKEKESSQTSAVSCYPATESGKAKREKHGVGERLRCTELCGANVYVVEGDLSVVSRIGCGGVEGAGPASILFLE